MAAEAERAMFVAKPDLLMENEVIRARVIPAQAGIQSPGTWGRVWMPAYAGMTLRSSNAFRRHLLRDRIQLTVIGHKFSIRLFAGSYKQLISGPLLGLHSEPTSKARHSE